MLVLQSILQLQVLQRRKFISTYRVAYRDDFFDLELYFNLSIFVDTN